MAIIAVLGTTISPYLFFWQASQEVEEVKANRGEKALKHAPAQASSVGSDSYGYICWHGIFKCGRLFYHPHRGFDIAQSRYDRSSDMCPGGGCPQAHRRSFRNSVVRVRNRRDGNISGTCIGGVGSLWHTGGGRWIVSLERRPHQVRSNLWPTAAIALTAVDANPGTPLTAGALNNPILYQRAAAGAMVTQLITDFGRTTNLVSSAKLAAQAENQNALATKEQILLAVDQAFYNSLQAHAVLTVAQQTVKERQTVSNQVDALFQSKLKSQLDLSFANVNLAQAKLLLLEAKNNENAALAGLSAVLGFSNLQSFQLVDDTTPSAPPPGNVDDLITTAFSVRPEILALEFQSESAKKFQTAERDLLFPDIRALGVVGDTPVRNPIAGMERWG
jgi:hypothetical protein